MEDIQPELRAIAGIIIDVLQRHFGVELPANPGHDALPTGHLHEFALATH